MFHTHTHQLLFFRHRKADKPFEPLKEFRESAQNIDNQQHQLHPRYDLAVEEIQAFEKL